jgi:DNA-binding transcriptional MerR regulator
MEEKGKLFSILQVSEKLNIPKHTLRFWEKELNGLVVPLRTNGGQRRYTVQNLFVLGEIKKYRDSGYSIPEIVEKIGQSGEVEAPGTAEIDLLVSRVSEVVRTEVYNFLRSQKGEE